MYSYSYSDPGIILLHNKLTIIIHIVVVVVTSFEVIHDLAGLPNPTEVGSSHCLRVLSVSSLARTWAISNTNTT
jgi:hypothetical protein